MMPRTKNVYTERLTVKITRHMLADLNNVAAKGGDSVSAVVRQAIRNYLDGTDLTLGTRRTFDRRVQKMMADMEQNLMCSQEQGLKQMEQTLKESLDKELATVQYRAHKAVEAALSELDLKVSKMVREHLEELRGKRRR
jgi:metal-responsive CopG/Arc/MetJ family transcriptional regulator